MSQKQYADRKQMVLFSPEERKLQIEAANASCDLLSHITAKKLIWLSENFRGTPFEQWYMQWGDMGMRGIDWGHVKITRSVFSHLAEPQYCAMLKLGTFMDNGYYRQRCMEALEGLEGTLPFFVLRLNDWVEQVRESAYILTQKRLRECGLAELFFSLPMMEKVRNSGRRQSENLRMIEEQVKVRVLQKFSRLSEEELKEIPFYEINVKNAVYRLVSQERILEREQMERLLALEKAGYGKKLLILGIFWHYGYEQARIERYLMSSSAVVRYHALLYRYEVEHNAWAGLEKLLLDRSKRIRVYAGYILKKHAGMDVLGYYLEKLSQNATKEVLLGIGEYGSRKEMEVLRPFLESEELPMVKAALEAYGKLAAETGREVYWRFLTDDRPFVARQAMRLSKKYRVCYGAKQVYEAFLRNRTTSLGGCFLEMLLREPSWERLPFLLLLYGDQELSEDSRDLILAGINCRSSYGKVPARQGQWIREILEARADVIPKEIQKEILFDLKFVSEPISAS